MQQQIDPMTGMPIADPQQQAPANNFITQPQQKVGQDIFGGQSLPTPIYKMDSNFNGEAGVQQEDFEQF